MGKRRRVREAVVQFLYAAGTEEIPSLAADSPALVLLLEPLEERRIRAQAKALVHLQQGRASCLGGLEELVRRLARIELSDPADTSVTPLRELFESETALRDGLESLQRELNGNKNPATLATLLADIRKHNQVGRSAATRLQDARPDFPALEKLRDEALALGRNLPRYVERTAQALNEPPGELPELENCRKIQAEITEMRGAITSHTDAIIANRRDIDSRIKAAVDNYTPERIDRIDRAILRLSAYELLHTPEIPPAIVINEAIELARAFGTTDSPRFVNGVLDRIRKSADKSPGEDCSPTL